MRIEENINVVAIYHASSIFYGVNDAVDDEPRSDGI